MMDSKCNYVAGSAPPSHMRRWEIDNDVLMSGLALKSHKPQPHLTLQSTIAALVEKSGSIQDLVAVVTPQGHYMVVQNELRNH